jgi:hypothetical protein
VIFPDSVLLTRDGFCIYGWGSKTYPTGSLAWTNTVTMEAPVWRGDYKSDRDSIQTELVEYEAYGAHRGCGSPLCFAERTKKEPKP